MSSKHFAPPPSAAGSATSRAAAAAIAPHAPTQRRAVYDHIAAHGPITREAIAVALGVSQASITPRVHELIAVAAVRVVDSDGRTRSGRRAERLMRTALPYPTETPTTPPVQRTLQFGG